MLQVNEQIELVVKLLKLTIDEVKSNYGIIDSNGTLYFSEPFKGGRSIIIGQDGTVLFADSSIGYDEHLQEFENGRRTPLETFE